MRLSTTWAHPVNLAILVAAYVIVTLTGHDANPVIYIIGGYVGGAGVGAASKNGKNGS